MFAILDNYKKAQFEQKRLPSMILDFFNVRQLGNNIR